MPIYSLDQFTTSTPTTVTVCGKNEFNMVLHNALGRLNGLLDQCYLDKSRNKVRQDAIFSGYELPTKSDLIETLRFIKMTNSMTTAGEFLFVWSKFNANSTHLKNALKECVFSFVTFEASPHLHDMDKNLQRLRKAMVTASNFRIMILADSRSVAELIKLLDDVKQIAEDKILNNLYNIVSMKTLTPPKVLKMLNNFDSAESRMTSTTARMMSMPVHELSQGLSGLPSKPISTNHPSIVSHSSATQALLLADTVKSNASQCAKINDETNGIQSQSSSHDTGAPNVKQVVQPKTKTNTHLVPKVIPSTRKRFLKTKVVSEEKVSIAVVNDTQTQSNHSLIENEVVLSRENLPTTIYYREASNWMHELSTIELINGVEFARLKQQVLPDLFGKYTAYWKDDVIEEILVRPFGMPISEKVIVLQGQVMRAKSTHESILHLVNSPYLLTECRPLIRSVLLKLVRLTQSLDETAFRLGISPAESREKKEIVVFNKLVTVFRYQDVQAQLLNPVSFPTNAVLLANNMEGMITALKNQNKENVTYLSEEQIPSMRLASGDSINDFILALLGDSVHFIHPNALSMTPIFLDGEIGQNAACEFAINFMSHQTNDATHTKWLDPVSDLEKPLVLILNTQTFTPSDTTNATQVGGSHWVSLVILPKNYQTMQGKKLNNEKYSIFYFNSINLEAAPPKSLIDIIQLGGVHATPEGVTYSFEGLGVDAIELVSTGLKADNTQQVDVWSCGWWAIYNTLMVLQTGSNEFLQKQLTSCNIVKKAAALLLHNAAPLLAGNDNAVVLASSQKGDPKNVYDYSDKESVAAITKFQNQLFLGLKQAKIAALALRSGYLSKAPTTTYEHMKSFIACFALGTPAFIGLTMAAGAESEMLEAAAEIIELISSMIHTAEMVEHFPVLNTLAHGVDHFLQSMVKNDKKDIITGGCQLALWPEGSKTIAHQITHTYQMQITKIHPEDITKFARYVTTYVMYALSNNMISDRSFMLQILNYLVHGYFPENCKIRLIGVDEPVNAKDLLRKCGVVLVDERQSRVYLDFVIYENEKAKIVPNHALYGYRYANKSEAFFVSNFIREAANGIVADKNGLWSISAIGLEKYPSLRDVKFVRPRWKSERKKLKECEARLAMVEAEKKGQEVVHTGPRTNGREAVVLQPTTTTFFTAQTSAVVTPNDTINRLNKSR